MFVMLGVFLFNLLCGLVPCDPNLGKVQVSSNRFLEIGFRDGRPVNKSEIPARATVSSGKVEGYHMKTVEAREIFAFEGIPYGKADRWKVKSCYSLSFMVSFYFMATWLTYIKVVIGHKCVSIVAVPILCLHILRNHFRFNFKADPDKLHSSVYICYKWVNLIVSKVLDLAFL